MEQGSLRQTLRPLFSPLLAGLEAAAFALVGATALAVVLGTLLLLFLTLLGAAVGFALYFGLFMLGLLLLPPAYYKIKRKAYDGTHYRFYDDSLEFDHFPQLLIRRRGRIFYRDIAQAAVRTGLAQQREGLASLYLLVPALGAMHGGFPGLKISDVPQEQAESILALIDRARRGGVPPPQPPAAGAQTHAVVAAE